MNAAEWLVRSLRTGGVERVFVLCGNGLRRLCGDYLLGNEALDDLRGGSWSETHNGESHSCRKRR